jgi:hypothetical protein
MNNLELIASDIALLSNDDLTALAELLVKDFEPRAEALATFIGFAQMDKEYGKQEIFAD